MDNKEPTREQIKEFWEKQGFRWDKASHCFFAPNVLAYLLSELSDFKNIRYLGWLFKYAVPKLEVNQRLKILQRWVTYICTNPYDDPALALFWAIWEVQHE